MEIRPYRAVHRAAIRADVASRQRLQISLRHKGLFGPGAGRANLGLSRRSDGAAAAPLGAVGMGRGGARHLGGGASLQLASVPGELARPRAYRMAACLSRKLRS